MLETDLDTAVWDNVICCKKALQNKKKAKVSKKKSDLIKLVAEVSKIHH